MLFRKKKKVLFSIDVRVDENEALHNGKLGLKFSG